MLHTPPGVFLSVGKWMSHHVWYEFDSNQENTQIPVNNYFELQLQISSSFVLFHAFLNSCSIILIGVQKFVSVVTALKESRITKSKRLPERKEEQQPCWEVSSWQHCKKKMKIFCKRCKTPRASSNNDGTKMNTTDNWKKQSDKLYASTRNLQQTNNRKSMLLL